MNHARVKALKGNGKTVSKKAVKSGRASGHITPQSSPMASLLTSPTHSTNPSRVTSDISDSDDDDLDDDLGSSIHSGGSLSEAADDVGASFDANALISGLQDRKHNNSDTREQLLEVYIKVLRTRYTAETHHWLDDAASALCDVFLKDANRGATARERLLSLQAYCLTVGTSEDLEIFDQAQRALKQIMTDDDDEDCKAYAIYALCMSVLYAGGLEQAALDVMEFLVDVVQTDGETIESHDIAGVVSAALQGWAFVASHVDDFSDFAEAAMDAFVDQLDSTDVEVQSNCGTCIALIFEASRNHEEETGQSFQLQYDPQRLTGRLTELAKLSAKSVSRKNRRDLRESLLSVVTSLERGVGPYYSTALYIPEKGDWVPPGQRTEDGQAEYGYRYKLRYGNSATRVDSWSLFCRVNMMKMIFRGGLQKHLFVNPVVMECLDDANWNQDYTPETNEKKSTKGRKK